MASGHVFVLVGAGGSGKTTLIRAVRKRYPDVRFMPTTTTRPPRPGEVHGREYFFVDTESFERMKAEGALLEWAAIHGNFYGTSRERIQSLLDEGHVGITSLDYQGAFAVKRAFPDRSTTIFVHPPSVEDLRQRLLARNDTTPEDIEKRIRRAEEEAAQAERCDFELLNATGKLEEAVEALLGIMESVVGEKTLKMCAAPESGPA